MQDFTIHIGVRKMVKSCTPTHSLPHLHITGEQPLAFLGATRRGAAIRLFQEGCGCACTRVVSEPGESQLMYRLCLGTGRDKLLGWWHPGEIKGLGFDIWLSEGT